MTMTGAAQLDTLPGEAAGSSGLRQQVVERLAAHRLRRGHSLDVAERLAMPVVGAGPKHRIAAAIAERYAQTPSYRALLAAEAERAIQQAAAAAEVAARNAEAVVLTQRELLAELAMWTAPQEFANNTSRAADERMESVSRRAKLTVRLYGDPSRTESNASEMPEAQRAGLRLTLAEDQDEALALDEEISFRQAPVFEDHAWKHEPSIPLTANLLEFPRQLVATRRARPRLAEGPLRDESENLPRMRIFEANPGEANPQEADFGEANSWEVNVGEGNARHTSANPVGLPQWTSIWLDSHASRENDSIRHSSQEEELMHVPAGPVVARFGLRVKATAIDGGLIIASLLLFVAVVAKLAGPIELGLPIALGAFGTLIVFLIVYQVLFFTFGDQTPGMRCARIGFCTFHDENPSRAAIRRRIWAQAVSICALGLGLVWALIDEDRLSWHDRISKMYQRSY